MSLVLQVCHNLRVRQVHFYVCWLKQTSNSCINSILGYKCYHSGIGDKKNPSNPVHMTLPRSQHTTSIDHINMICQHVIGTISIHTSDCILLGRASHYPGMPHSPSSSTDCYFVALLSRYSTKLHTIFTLIYFWLQAPTSLHHHQHGTYGQQGEESLFTEESRSAP